MGRLIIPLLALVGLVAGGAAGLALKPAPVPPDDGESAAPPRDRPATPAEFYEMDSHFVVPLIGQDRIRGLMVLSLGLEVGPGEVSGLRALEPRLRDAFLRVLFDHANAGGFDGRFTSASQMDLLRAALREAAQSMMPGVRDVLIVEMIRQDT